MLSTTRGVRQAYSIVQCGRAGEPLWEVGEDGDPLVEAGNFVVLTDERVRGTYGGRRPQRHAMTGLAAAQRRWDQFLDSLTAFEKLAKDLAAVPTAAGRSYLEEQGWPEDEIEPVILRMNRISSKLGVWQDRWMARNVDDAEEDE